MDAITNISPVPILRDALARVVAAREEFDRGTADLILADLEDDLAGYLAESVCPIGQTPQLRRAA